MAKQLKLSDLFSASKADNSSTVSPAAKQQNPDTQDKPEGISKPTSSTSNVHKPGPKYPDLFALNDDELRCTNTKLQLLTETWETAHKYQFQISSPGFGTMSTDIDMSFYTGLLDQRVKLPTSILSPALALTTELSQQANITETADKGLEHCTVDVNITSCNKLGDWMVMEPMDIMCPAVEPISMDLLSQKNITCAVDDNLKCTLADNMTSHTEFLDDMIVEPTDVVPAAVLAQVVVEIDTAFKGVEIYSGLIVDAHTDFLLRLGSEIKKIIKEGRTAILDPMVDIENDYDGQQSHITRSTYKNAKLNRKIDSVSTDLNDEHNDLGRMQEGLNDWKQEWLEQSHKIRQFNPDHIKQLSEQSGAKVDKFIEEQQKEIGDRAHYLGGRFHEINKHLEDRHQDVLAMFTDLDTIHDVMNGQSASQFLN